MAVMDEHPTTYPIGHGDARCKRANQVKDGGACAYHHMYVCTCRSADGTALSESGP